MSPRHFPALPGPKAEAAARADRWLYALAPLLLSLAAYLLKYHNHV